MFNPGDKLHGFEVISCEPLAEIDGDAIVMHHAVSGARLLYLRNDDENKSFCIGFRTPPADDTGVFHILEHSVLCGSRKYPVKEPFVNLLRTSMQTFLNALTFPDKTMYPVASTNEQDLMNLMDVYLDAVLHPRIYDEPEIFAQEGWHYELADVAEGAEECAGRLSYNGVVFNEMKGSLSDPESVLYRKMNRALFPHSCYAFESGGDPRKIPTLTYEAFVDNHARHYRLDNSYLVLYGDLNADRILAYLDEEYLSVERPRSSEPANPMGSFEPVVVAHEKVPMITAPDNATVGVGYVVGAAHDFERVMAVDVLMDALMGGNESPIKRVLLDAGLGGDCTAYLMDAQEHPAALFVLRNAAPDAAERFQQIIEEQAARLVKEGIPREQLEASLSQMAFSLRERDRGMADGVVLSMNALSTWLYDDADATRGLHYEGALTHLRAGLEGRYYEEVLESLVCASKHRALVEIVPTAVDGETEEQAELRAHEERLTRADEQAIQQAVAALRARQEAPDAPEDLAKLPRIHVSDIGPGKPDPAFELREDGPLPCLAHNMPTRNIDYLGLYFSLHTVAWEDIPYVSVLCMLLGSLATETRSAAEVDTWARRHLGNLRFLLSETPAWDDNNVVRAFVIMTASALSEEVDNLATIPREIWATTRFDDTERIRDILVQRRVAMEQMFMSSGHTAAMSRSSSYLFKASVMQEQRAGVDFYLFLRDLIDHFDERAADLTARLNRLRDVIFIQDGLLCSFTGSEEDHAAFWKAAGDFGLPESAPAVRLEIPEPTLKREAFVVPSDVVYVARSAEAGTTADHSGAWLVLTSPLSLDYLWNEVRVQGGAYGCGFRRNTAGSARFYSYRDPHIDETLARFEAAGDWLACFDPDPADMEGYIVSSVASHDAPAKPRLIAQREDLGYLIGFPANHREKIRAEMLACTPETLRGFADVVRAVSTSPAVCVFGSGAIIDASHEELMRVDLLGS